MSVLGFMDPFGQVLVVKGKGQKLGAMADGGGKGKLV